ncbi:glycosyltransferase family 4 protein [Rhizobium herbae]|uniref:Glycosyltransferase involved in cell wall biosynthesis n=1 Tax=Rhizobium herbae TaxID=508661 RepID=A0ABS4ERT5_9HYPH|nr:glycosyltransferase family 4 protein [Rhizobium herbae]MBP1860670.1 glycosyltransferase involved in cell wall biosynthesis [Rhizobium herbae]
MSSRPTYVLIATPLGEGGMGGIDRIMDEVRKIARLKSPGHVSISFGATRGQGSILLSPVYLFSFLARMALLKVLGRIDVLHINLSSHGSTKRKIIVARWARLLGIPYVIHLHGSRFRQFWNESAPGVASAITQMFASASRIVVLGNVWKSFVAEKVPGASARIVIIPNATPTPRLSPVEDEAGHLRILFLGRVGPRKGVPQLVEALSMLPKDGSWRATIAGDGDVEETRQEIERLGLTDRVALPGWVGPDEVAELLSGSDVLVLPSFDENLPMSVIEGMAAGLAIIATPVGAVEDIIIDGETGLLVPVGDSNAIAASIQFLLDQPQARKALGKEARRLHGERLEIGMYFARLVDLWAGKNF